MTTEFTEKDRAQLREHGVMPEEAERQLRILQADARKVKLDRPCTRGDGILEIAEHEIEELRQQHFEAARSGRWTKFTPASGAASRMFQLNAEQQERFCNNIDRFAFASQLFDQGEQRGVNVQAAAKSNDFETIREILLTPKGLNYDRIAKGLLPFHRRKDEVRTAFQEHLYESAECFANADRASAAHFTVGAEHREEFQQQLAEFESLEPEERMQVEFSIQDPATDTIGIANARPLRHENGSLVLRPGGHGALLGNLNALAGDLVFVKNIDNVQHFDRSEAARTWIEATCGLLVRLQSSLFELQLQMEKSPCEENIDSLQRSYADIFPTSPPSLTPTHEPRRPRYRDSAVVRFEFAAW